VGCDAYRTAYGRWGQRARRATTACCGVSVRALITRMSNESFDGLERSAPVQSGLARHIFAFDECMTCR
jgi:hypothetical protein